MLVWARHEPIRYRVVGRGAFYCYDRNDVALGYRGVEAVREAERAVRLVGEQLRPADGVIPSLGRRAGRCVVSLVEWAEPAIERADGLGAGIPNSM